MTMMNVHKMMTEIAHEGGRIEFPETDLPYPAELVDAAIDAGWIKHCMEGGAGGTWESLKLTDDGRKLLGLRPAASLSQWLTYKFFALVGRSVTR